MKVGDLVKVLTVTDHPIGMILDVRDHTSGYKIQHYLVQLFGKRSAREMKAHQYLKHHLEVVR
tara:strand:- start:139 stop:327 length:189 start_codon:yes stop_codon:yes gene_type:complete